MEGRSLIRMRGYYVPLAAGVALTVSAFLPWVIVGDAVVRGVPTVPALWVAGLGAIAAVLAGLSIITRKNSRHPLLIVGLVALGIMVLSWRILPRSAGEHVLTFTQALAIVENTPVAASSAPIALAGSGIYLGLVASTVIVLFGMTIVIKRVSQPYAVSTADDDV